MTPSRQAAKENYLDWDWPDPLTGQRFRHEPWDRLEREIVAVDRQPIQNQIPAAGSTRCLNMLLKWKFGLILAMATVINFPELVRGDGREVAVVYNSNLPESKSVAEYYARARQIPQNQLFGYRLGTGLEMSRGEFSADLQQPLADDLVARGLWQFGDMEIPYLDGVPKHVNHVVVSSKIRYLVLCFGVPVRITEDSELHKLIPTNYPAAFHANTAAVDSELAWLPMYKNPVQLAGLLPNWIYGATNLAQLDPTNGILLVTRLDGPTPEIARGLVDKAMAAERDGLWGRAYCDARGLEKTNSYYYGDAIMLESADTCKKLGYDTILDTNAATFSAAFPLSNIAIYCGWYDGTVSGPFTLPQVEFMPGAFAYHLHSYSAADIRSTNNNWVGPLLAKGATCTMGCVSEPYLTFTPDIAFFLRALAHGWTFGEAAWASQPALSWQTTVVGDPLYRPFSKQPLGWFTELFARHSPLLDWAIIRVVNFELERGGSLEKASATLEQVPDEGGSAVLSQKLAELNEKLGKPSAAIDYYERALTLKPTRQQRIGLRLALGILLRAQHRMAEARDNYQSLLKEIPDYAGQSTIREDLKQIEITPANPEPAHTP